MSEATQDRPMTFRPLTEEDLLRLPPREQWVSIGEFTKQSKSKPPSTERRSVEQLLRDNDIDLPSTAPGEFTTVCPQCSHTRGKSNAKCLSVKIDHKGACWHCHHCGWTGPEKGTGKTSSGTREPEATYDFDNASGKLIFQKIRNAAGSKNKFTCRQPDGRGGWIYNLKGITKKPLYRWPEVLEAIAQGKEIAIAEGEKDCNRLWSIGIPATCNFDGAAPTHDKDGAPLKNYKPKWKREYSEQLAGARLIVFQDNDEPGARHADVICEMSIGKAKSVRRLDLALHWPDMPEGADVSDWFAKAGGTREQLDKLIVEAPDYSEASGTPPAAVEREDFRAYMPTHSYVYLPTRELWPGSSVDAQLGSGAAIWLDQNRSVVQMTWAPGLPMLIADRVVAEGGWIEKPGVMILNLYRPPTLVHGDATQAGPWVDLVHRVYPDDADHIIKFFAHRVQRPHEKINHGLVLGGEPGIGKDSLCEPVKRAVGPWNCAEVSPTQMLGRFNGFVKSVILRVSEARDLGEMNRFALYEHMKVYLASPPDVLRCDEKHIREHAVFNVCGVIITSNRKDSFFLPADDRRHYVAWSDCSKDDFTKEYWDEIWAWYNAGGDGHVAAYLATLDLADFHPKAPPAKTPVFWEIVQTNRAPEDAELADALAKLGDPKAVTVNMIKQYAEHGFAEWLRDRRNARAISHRLEDAGYVSVRNPAAKDGRWKIHGIHTVIYARKDLSIRERHIAATGFQREQQEAARRAETEREQQAAAVRQHVMGRVSSRDMQKMLDYEQAMKEKAARPAKDEGP
jgi:Family of unknown function (DUF5906)